jgi:hypothetical protein
MTIHALVPVAAFITTLNLAPQSMPAPTAAALTDAPHAMQAPRWQAWHGCWEMTGEGVPADRLVCAVPGETAAEVRLIAVSGGFVTGEAVLRADGAPRPLEEGGCTGHETATWSQDGRRVFIRTELDCDGFRRVSSGIIAMVSEREWVDIRAAAIFDQHLTRTQRYRAVPADRVPESVRAPIDETRPVAMQTARFVAAMPLGMDEVVEASGRMPTPALQAFLAARGDRLGINGRNLVQLADAGVAPEVIEVMVALAYPDHFNVRQPTVASPLDAEPATRVGTRADECYDPYTRRWVYGRVCDSRYGFGRFGYGGWDYWGYGSPTWGPGWTGGYVGGGTVVIVEPREPRQPERPAELIRGTGYTRGSAEPRGTATPRSGSGSATGPGSTGSGSTATGASSSGSSSSDTSPTRTAVPRTGGGGE